MMVSSMVVKLSSIKKMMIAMKSGQRALRWAMKVEANAIASLDDKTFACLMGEVYEQKFTKAIMMSEDEDDEDN